MPREKSPGLLSVQTRLRRTLRGRLWPGRSAEMGGSNVAAP